MVIRRHFLKFIFPLLALSLALLLFFLSRPQAQAEPIRIAVLVTLEDVLLPSFSVGDTLTDGATKESLGTVTEMQISPYYEETENGVFPYPGKSRVILTIGGKGVMRNGRVTVGGVAIATGKRLSLHGRGAAEGVCLWTKKEQAE